LTEDIEQAYKDADETKYENQGKYTLTTMTRAQGQERACLQSKISNSNPTSQNYQQKASSSRMSK
jgi:hypothetical protein